MPILKDRSWHESFCEVIALSGNESFACRRVKVSYDTYQKHLAKYPTFEAKVKEARIGFSDLILDEGLKRVRAGSDTMIREYLRAYRPEFSPKSTVEHKLSDADRRLIEKMCRENGVDPSEVIREVEMAEQRRGRLRIA